MKKIYRIEVWPKRPKGNPHVLQSIQHQFGGCVTFVEEVPLFWLATNENLDPALVQQIADTVFVDSVIEFAQTEEGNISHQFNYALEISYRPGVTDNSAAAAKEGVEITSLLKGKDFQLASGKMVLLTGKLDAKQAKIIAEEILANQLLQKVDLLNWGSRFGHFSFPEVHLVEHAVNTISLDCSEEQLMKLNTEKTWALSLEELRQVKSHFQMTETQKIRQSKGLPLWPTDVEMEVIAQTWSEHCKHKIFAANINYSEDLNLPATSKRLGTKRVQSVFKTYIRNLTEEVKKDRGIDWTVSVFSDNAGILRFDPKLDVCIKVETHNSPSALDPYGGALTGILGVNRDILGAGVGALPIANTDVFCFSEEREKVELPSGLKNPVRIFNGVHKGVEDGGNKSGIPTVNGAIHFDDNFAGKPLVYCGTLGVIPHKVQGQDSYYKGQQLGDKIVMAGGAIGADGIHGATFSSMELTEGAPATVVQIGDPLTQKRLMDFLMEARDLGLYSGVTDNGAGGLSSSIGEMAQLTGGALIDLKKARVKYPGLSPYELMISESQERMSLAVPEKNLEQFMTLARQRGVCADVLGEFTDSGFFEVYYGDKLVANLSLHFLHESLVPMELNAKWEGPLKRQYWHGHNLDQTTFKSNDLLEQAEQALKTLLARPTIQSKEKWVRQYDHEVKASTVVKPFTGIRADGPSDAGVVWLAPYGGDQKNAVTLSCGICPQYSHIDTYQMAQYAVDEAVRNAVATGADPEAMALVDNFCWPDPIESKKTPDGQHKLAQLVRTGEGLFDIAKTYGMPMVSGKDSMKNDFQAAQVKISVPPTLLMTAVGRLPNVEKVVTTDFKLSGDKVYFLGTTDFSKKYYSEFAHCFEHTPTLELPEVDTRKNFDRYKKLYSFIQNDGLRSCHDISEGGLLVALAECCIGGRLGIGIELDNFVDKGEDLLAKFFNEFSGGFILSVKPEQQESLEKHFNSSELRFVGTLFERPLIRLQSKESVRDIEIKELLACWKGGIQ